VNKPVNLSQIAANIDITSVLTAEERKQIAAEEAENEYWEKYPNRLRGLDFLGKREKVTMLVENLVPRAGLGQLYGESYAGKTFVAIDLACTIASGGRRWMGENVEAETPADVVYVAAEGGQAFWDAVEGWMKGHPQANHQALREHLHVLDGDNGDFLKIGMDDPFGNDKTGLQRLIVEMSDRGINPALIVMDPQINIFFDADESSNNDMGGVYESLRSMAFQTETLILLVHHTGWDSSRMRGASAMFGALNLVIRASVRGKKGHGEGRLRFEKIKGYKVPDKDLDYSIQGVGISGGSGSGAYLLVEGAAPETVDTREQTEEQVKLLLTRKALRIIAAGATNGVQITQEMGIKKQRVTDLVKRLIEEDLVDNNGSTSKPVYEINDFGIEWLANHPEDEGIV
jgi:hypothetical protein